MASILPLDTRQAAIARRLVETVGPASVDDLAPASFPARRGLERRGFGRGRGPDFWLTLRARDC